MNYFQASKRKIGRREGRREGGTSTLRAVKEKGRAISGIEGELASRFKNKLG